MSDTNTRTNQDYTSYIDNDNTADEQKEVTVTNELELENKPTQANHSKISICIPRIDNSINENYIRRVFNQVLIDKTSASNTSQSEQNKPATKINFIERIDLIDKKNEKNEAFKRAFIHFRNWDKLTSHNSQMIWDKLQAGEVIKIMHKQPNYWKCSLSRVPRPTTSGTHNSTSAPNHNKPKPKMSNNTIPKSKPKDNDNVTDNDNKTADKD